MKTVFLLIIALCMVTGVTAQESGDVALVGMTATVEIQGADGVSLFGDFYAADMNNPTPGVLLMHMYGGRRGDWEPLVQPLIDAGYSVLAVDLRGHGESRATRDWVEAQNDVRLWLDWLSAQPFVDAERIAVIGASVGSNLALVGCAAYESCDTAVALSPGLDFYGVSTPEAIEALDNRSALLVSAVGDSPSGDDVRDLVDAARGEIGLQLYSGWIHGTGLFYDGRSGAEEGLIPLIVLWLDGHVQAE